MLATARSPHTVAETVDRLVSALQKRGVRVFARINHAAGARSVGLELPDQEVLIFGNPQVGTPLMQSDPTVGYELPLRVLTWDADGQTMVGYRPPSELVKDYSVAEQTASLETMTGLLEQLVAESTAPA